MIFIRTFSGTLWLNWQEFLSRFLVDATLASKVVTNSEAIISRLVEERWLPEDRVHVIYNRNVARFGADAEEFIRALGLVVQGTFGEVLRMRLDAVNGETWEAANQADLAYVEEAE